VTREAIAVVNAESGRIALWNPAAEALFGYPAAEAMELSLAALLAERVRNDVPQGLVDGLLRRFCALPAPDSGLELPAVRRDGSEIAVELFLFPLERAPRFDRSVLLVFHDASERHRAEDERVLRVREEAARAEAEAARRRAAFLASVSKELASSLDCEVTLRNVARLAVESLADWCAVDLVDADGSVRRVAAARAGQSDRGESADEHEPSPPELAEAAAEVRRTGSSILVPSDAVPGRGPAAGPRTDAGTVRPRAYMVVPLIIPDRLLGTITLVSEDAIRGYGDAELALAEELARHAALAIERARLYEEAQHANARYRKLFEGMADAALVADEATRIVDANHAATELLEYSLEELRQLRLDDVIVGGMELVREHLVRRPGHGQWQSEFEVRKRDGSYAPVEAWGTSVRLPGGTVYVGSLRDISARRQQEQAQQELLAMVSHELRSPLTSIKAYAQLMQMNQAYNEHAVEAIIAQTTRSDRLIDDLMDVARLEAGRLPLYPTRVELIAVVQSAAEQVRTSNSLHTVRVVAPEKPLYGRWDRDRLEQVLQNLLSNAVKYSPNGGEVIVHLEDLGEVARVTVTDQGIGISPDALGHLFERYYRSTNRASRNVKGLGLGLYISRALVEAHGGRIWAESPGLGQGSSFSFTLPYAERKAT
jgi:PAS domain S-box-containing protein